MPIKSKQPARQTKNKTKKAQVRQRSSSPVDERQEKSGDGQEIEDQSSDEEAPRLDMTNLLKALEDQSKQKLAKKQNKTFQEIEAVLQGALVERLNNLIQTQESELEGIVSDYFNFKAQTEDQKDELIKEIINQQQSFQTLLKMLEDNLDKYIKKVEGQSSSAIQQLSQLDRRNGQLYDFIAQHRRRSSP
ncbi:hypothetical protein PTTG_04824 [Puccinia triticina 1-1 BBBD Race 1]|uniref:Uncharacterized protein n=1 Tax=Puccinia triticina (isolate 1-1 / race 1 (BBBD)) TaxID=630390 RepID=A0A180GD24_PUCT1|nr:hypothetical protein PTTG_04824 [Puccinia triticina 1-1 BBBD Race 1]